MLLTYLLTTLFTATFSLPTDPNSASLSENLTPVPEPYNCGYVLTASNSSSFCGLYALDRCEAFFYNDTIADYQDAFAYHLYGGCECKFFG